MILQICFQELTSADAVLIRVSDGLLIILDYYVPWDIHQLNLLSRRPSASAVTVVPRGAWTATAPVPLTRNGDV
ncbi:hypothetical protein D5S17_32960 [Pseudonocardiaceae bacterium YIM PH 21723]|nr:hypothetical protein D5S17_32960 [Pseudonocardiaceae bacterium YIM PH 21723]